MGLRKKIELKSYLTDLRMVCNLEVARCLSCHNQVDKAVDFPLDIHQHAPDPNSERIDIINISVITSAMYSTKLEDQSFQRQNISCKIYIGVCF